MAREEEAAGGEEGGESGAVGTSQALASESDLRFRDMLVSILRHYAGGGGRGRGAVRKDQVVRGARMPRRLRRILGRSLVAVIISSQPDEAKEAVSQDRNVVGLQAVTIARDKWAWPASLITSDGQIEFVHSWACHAQRQRLR
jgi:hypothetical protein